MAFKVIWYLSLYSGLSGNKPEKVKCWDVSFSQWFLCPCHHAGSSMLLQALCLRACCLVKAASSGRRLGVTSGSLIKWIWFLRGNSRLHSPGARPTLVSIWLTCVGCWEGGVVYVCVRMWERECQYVQYTVYLSRYMCVCVSMSVRACAVWCIERRGSG